jgi:SAM-dependent methyltransferase
MSTTPATFDKVAYDYDRLWSSSRIGTSQRSAFWQAVDPLFTAGERVLDLGCGTGVDARHLQAAGVDVLGIDSSPKMIAIAQQRGIDARLLPIEEIGSLRGQFDGAISNFGALNCVRDLDVTVSALAKLMRRGGHIALCFLGRVCAWEISYYLFRGNPGKAFRRLKGRCGSDLVKDVFYFASSSIIAAFEPDFRLRRRLGIGLFVPPSYVGTLNERLVTRLSAADRRLAHRPILRALSDHSLYVFERL